MPEIPDVIGGDTIAAGWGNTLRDRVVQRYATEAERDVLTPTPSKGELAYLQDTNDTTIFRGVEWRTFVVEVDGGITLPGDFVTSSPGRFQGPG